MFKKAAVEGLTGNNLSAGFDPRRLNAELDKAMAFEANAGVIKRSEEKVSVPINLRGGWEELPIDLANTTLAATAGLINTATCYAVVYTRDGSYPGGILDIEFQPSGGTITNVLPGTLLRIPGGASRIVIKRNSNSLAVGTARLLLQRVPDVDYDLMPGGMSVGGLTALAPFFYAQNYNQTNNVPGANDGVNLAGVTGLRAFCNCASGDTFLGGTARFWCYNTQTSTWALSNTAETIPAGVESFVTSDYVVAVPAGRVYVEMLSFTSAGGSGAGTVRIQTSGR